MNNLVDATDEADPLDLEEEPIEEVLERMLAVLRERKMTDVEKETQRRSFVYGNGTIGNPCITRDLVDQTADKLRED